MIDNSFVETEERKALRKAVAAGTFLLADSTYGMVTESKCVAWSRRRGRGSDARRRAGHRDSAG